MAAITEQQLENASVDAKVIEDFANGAADINGTGLIPRRLTDPVKSLDKIVKDATEDLATRDIGEGAAALINQRLDPLTASIQPLPREALGGGATSGFRFRIGQRTFAQFDLSGFTFHKMTLPGGTRLRPLAREVSDAIRIRIGTREIARYSHARGLEIHKVAFPSFVPATLPREVGDGLRIRYGNRELGRWTRTGGMLFNRMTLPIDTKLADDPNRTLLDRLSGGAVGSVVMNDTYVAAAIADRNGVLQIGTRRLSDGRRFWLTSGVTAFRSPTLTDDNKVLFWSDKDARLVYAGAEQPGVIGPVFPIDLISAEGDSLTAGAGAYTSGAYTQRLGPYPAILAEMMGVPIANRGVGGQTPRQISARDNGNPALLTVQGNQIPANGTVTVTAWSTPLNNNQGPGDIVGYLAGVRGTLKVTAFGGDNLPTGYTFTREEAGAAVACPPQTPYFTQIGIDDRPKRKLFLLGRNDPSQMVAETAKVVAYQNPLYPDYLVGAYLTAVGQGKPAGGTAENQQLAAIYGDRWVDLDSAPTANEMAFLGFVPDSYGAYTNGRTDAQDIADNYVPSGMRAGAFTGSGDFLHLNDFGYGLWALRFYRRIVQFGWFPNLPVL